MTMADGSRADGRGGGAARRRLPDKRTIPLLLVAAAMLLLPAAVVRAQTISVSIDRHARPSADGSFTFTVRVTCELSGIPDFREGLAGGRPT